MNDELRPQDWDVRAAAYRHLIDTFTAPETEDLAARLDMAFGIPAVLGGASLTRTRCAESGVPIEFGVRNDALINGRDQDPGALIHFAVPARHWYDNIAFT